ncbi:uncharacterized protein LOC126808424 isoform X2 [Patella vulgata]|uniref:uncharacterized protein LOC126808424 isoform X2 n=1 Tax=Patella vulgata TaxID=6465 RepID=UPI0024A929E2|nr:uncharacterized protein LOC126808424 isoform X2 [Patella vulgata]
MYTPIICLLLATACVAAPLVVDIATFEKNLKSQLETTAQHLIYEAEQKIKSELQNVFHLQSHQTRNTGKDLLKALEGSAIDSLTTATTGVVSNVVTNLVSGLTGKLTGVISNLIGHIGKRSTGKDLLKALEGSAIDSLTTAATGVVSNAVNQLVSGLTGQLTGAIGKLLGHIGKRNTGHDLLEALKGTAITSVENSLTPVIDTVINTAVTKLTGEIGHIATNLLGHLHIGKRQWQAVAIDLAEKVAVSTAAEVAGHEIGKYIDKHLGKRGLGSVVVDLLEKAAVDTIANVAGHEIGKKIEGKRNIFKDLLSGVEQSIVGVEQSALQSLTGLATDKLNSLISKIGKRNIFKDLLSGVEQSIVGVEQSALQSLTGLATEKLNSLISKIGKRDAADVDVLQQLIGQVIGSLDVNKIGDLVKETMAGLPALFEKELTALLAANGI